jgi:hypothetical protein
MTASFRRRFVLAFVLVAALFTSSPSAQIGTHTLFCQMMIVAIHDAEEWEEVCVEEYQNFFEWLMGIEPWECDGYANNVAAKLTLASDAGCDLTWYYNE